MSALIGGNPLPLARLQRQLYRSLLKAHYRLPSPLHGLDLPTLSWRLFGPLFNTKQFSGHSFISVVRQAFRSGQLGCCSSSMDGQNIRRNFMEGERHFRVQQMRAFWILRQLNCIRSELLAPPPELPCPLLGAEQPAAAVATSATSSTNTTNACLYEDEYEQPYLANQAERDIDVMMPFVELFVWTPEPQKPLSNVAETISNGIYVKIAGGQGKKVRVDRAGRHFFVFDVLLRNDLDFSVKVLSEHWFFLDPNTCVMDEIRARAANSKTPVIHPGETFKYRAAYRFRSPQVLMKGTYQVMRMTNRRHQSPSTGAGQITKNFDVVVDPLLISPPQLSP